MARRPDSLTDLPDPGSWERDLIVALFVVLLSVVGLWGAFALV